MKLTAQTTRIDKGLDAFKKRLEIIRLRGAYVKAGILGAKGAAQRTNSLTVAQQASIHEYGLGNVPARPFIRPPFEINRTKYLEILKAGYRLATKNKTPEGFRKLLALVGQKMAADIKNYVTQGTGVPPPLSPKTIKRKGSSRPLVDTGQMLNSISYVVIE